MTVHLTQDTQRLAGDIHFSKDVSIEFLASVILHLKSGEDADRWVDLHVRGAGGGTHKIGFHYILPDSTEKTSKRAFHRMIGYLEKKLGTYPDKKNVPKGVKSWNIHSVYVFV